MISTILKKNILFNVATRKVSNAAAAIVYPTYITNAPLTEVSKTSNGVRVASEVSNV